MTLTNMQLSELFARLAAENDGHRARAYLRAAGEAMMWDYEAARLVEAEADLTSLKGIGPSLASKIRYWYEDPPEVPEPPPERTGFRSLAEALELIADHPEYANPLVDLQMHSPYSDGRDSLEEMVRGCVDAGREYACVTDHSAGQAIPKGMDADAITRQREEINRLEAQTGVRILQGFEMNLTPEGAGDTEPEVLQKIDLVLGSFHSKLRGTEDQTGRYLRALANPNVDVLAHPSARKWNMRIGLLADFEKVVHGAAVTGKAIEVDSHPHRQDLRDEHLAYAADANVTVSLGSDAHNVAELRFLPLGVAACIRAGVPTSRILNYMSPDQLLDWVAQRRS